MKKIFTSGILLMASAVAAIAQDGGAKPPTAVPEISALEGTAAIAALVAVVLLVWERRRRSV